MAITFEGRIASGQELLDGDLRDLDLVGIDGTLWLAAGTGMGIALYRLADDSGAATLENSLYHAVSGPISGRLAPLVLDGTPWLVLDGIGAGMVS